MKINVNYLELRYLAGKIAKLKEDAFNIDDCLNTSIGTASETEKAIISQLKTICTVTVPAMLNNTCNLLTTIANEFEKADQKFADPSNDMPSNEPQPQRKPLDINNTRPPRDSFNA